MTTTSTSLAGALQFYQSVLQLPLQPPSSSGSRGPQLHQQQQQPAQQKLSTRGFAPQQELHNRTGLWQQQQGASIPAYQNLQHQQQQCLPQPQQQHFHHQHQQHGSWQPLQTHDQAASLHSRQLAADAAQRQEVQQGSSGHTNQHQQHKQPGQHASSAPKQQQLLVQLPAAHRSAGPQHSFSPTGHVSAAAGAAAAAPAHVEAQLQPTPTPMPQGSQQRRQQWQHQQHPQQQRQQYGQKQAALSVQHQHQQKRLRQDASSLMQQPGHPADAPALQQRSAHAAADAAGTAWPAQPDQPWGTAAGVLRVLTLGPQQQNQQPLQWQQGPDSLVPGAAAGTPGSRQHRHISLQVQQPQVAPRARSNLLLQRLSSWEQPGEEAGPSAAPAAAAGLQQQCGPAAAAGGKGSTRWPWLGRDRRDAQGRQPGSPGFDPSTLFIPPAALSAMSEFGRQFWGIKSRTMDLVLFVRHGSFYNLFDVDADVGLRVGLNLSGPPAANFWKVGCFKDQFAVWAAKVLAQGYSVGRVEEMPAAAAAGGRAGGGSSKLLERRLVRIYTPGTAVEGLLLDDQDDMPHPLLCLAEVPYSTAPFPQHTPPSGSRPFASAAPSPSAAAAHAAAVGICLLDISSGVCRVGCFSTADDPARSALAVALLMSDPSEAVAVRSSLSPATLTLLKRHFEARTAAGPSFSCSSGGSSDWEGGSGGHAAGVSWLSAAAAGNVLSSPTAVLEGCVSPEQMQQLQQVAAQTGAAVSAHNTSSGGAASAAEAAMTAVLAAAVVAVKQLQRCSLLSDVLPTLEVQPLEALTAHGGMQPGRPLLLDSNAIVCLDLLPLSHVSGGTAGPTALAAAAALQGAAASSLFGLLDRTASAAGKRKLKQWICRPLTVASAIYERLDVLDLFLALPAAAQGLQQRLAALPDADRLLPKAAAAVRALLQQQQSVLNAQQQQQQLDAAGGALVDPMEGSAAQRERAWKALMAMPAALMGLIEAVATLRREVTAQHTDTKKLPLLHRAVLAAGRAAKPAMAINQLLSGASWATGAQPGSCDPAAAAGTKKARGKKAAAATAAAATASERGHGNSSGVRLAPGADAAYDAAVAEQQYLQDGYTAELQAQLQWYTSHAGNGNRGQQQQQWRQQQQTGLGLQVQDASVVDEAGGVIGLVVHLPAGSFSSAAAHQQPHTPGAWGPPTTGSSSSSNSSSVPDLLARLLAPGHTVIQQEVLQGGQDSASVHGQQQQGPGKPPRARGGPKAAAAAAAAAAAGASGSAAGQTLLLHVHVPELQQMWGELQDAEQQVAAAAAAAVDRIGQTFLDTYGVFRSLVAAVADLDVIAGFAQVVAPGQAPAGCSFCRPNFTSASAAAAAEASAGLDAAAPLLQLEGLWHPLLGMQSSSNSSGVVPNDVLLGGNEPGAMLLTGANMAGKSCLLRSTCVAVIMAQMGCYVTASSAVLAPVDAIFTRIGAADSIMCNKSTFMVEMSETAACLAAATPSSLIVLDELGRGTSTHDGYALAYAVLKHLSCRPDPPAAAAGWAGASPSGGFLQPQQQPAGGSTGGHWQQQTQQQLLPRVLFATHYHMLAQEEDLQGRVQSCHMSTQWDAVMRRLVHCYKLRPGAAPTGSCGIEVAALAGLPESVVQRAAAVAAVMQEHCEAGDGGGLLDRIQLPA